MQLHYFTDDAGHFAIICQSDHGHAQWKIVRIFDGKAVEFRFYTFDQAVRQLDALGCGWHELPVISSDEAVAAIIG